MIIKRGHAGGVGKGGGGGQKRQIYDYVLSEYSQSNQKVYFSIFGPYLPRQFFCGAIMTTAETEYIYIFFFDFQLFFSRISKKKVRSKFPSTISRVVVK